MKKTFSRWRRNWLTPEENKNPWKNPSKEKEPAAISSAAGSFFS
jgi:hypothetical protein